jgi:protein ImuA
MLRCVSPLEMMSNPGAQALPDVPQAVFSSGYAALDAVLPGGGWPGAALTELLLPQAGLGELRLLAPVLQRLCRDAGAPALCFDPPLMPNAWALQALGISPQQLLLIRPRDGAAGASGLTRPSAVPAPGSRRAPRAAAGAGPRGTAVQDMLWALEQSLRSGHPGVVLAWLPARLPGGTMPLRRLQLAAQTHPGPIFLLREEGAARSASPAPLRLCLASAGPDALQVQVLKRRGPPLAQTLVLQLPAVLAPAALARARARARAMAPNALAQSPTSEALG